jgi:hypothetical protein
MTWRRQADGEADHDGDDNSTLRPFGIVVPLPLMTLSESPGRETPVPYADPQNCGRRASTAIKRSDAPSDLSPRLTSRRRNYRSVRLFCLPMVS